MQFSPKLPTHNPKPTDAPHSWHSKGDGIKFRRSMKHAGFRLQRACAIRSLWNYIERDTSILHANFERSCY
jgi:hypothetical protein